MPEKPLEVLQPGESRCLLVVDTYVGLPRALSRAARGRYHVLTAQTGRQALERLKRFEPDLIVLDLMLPDVDGLLLMVRLRKKTNAPIVVCTSRSDPVDRALSRQLGAVDFVSKPVSTQELKARLEQAMTD